MASRTRPLFASKKGSTMRLNKPTRLALFLATALTCLSPMVAQAKKTQAAPPHQQATGKRIPPAIEDLEKRTFSWFWDSANPANGLIPDHYPTDSFASIASV